MAINFLSYKIVKVAINAANVNPGKAAILKNVELKNWSFGEAYFSKIKFGKIKAWKLHSKMTLNLIVPVGKVKFVFYSVRDGQFRVIKLGEGYYARLTVPPKIWFGFKGISRHESIILNLSNVKHDSKEILRRKISNIKFNW